MYYYCPRKTNLSEWMKITALYNLSMDGKLDFLSKGDLKFYAVPFPVISSVVFRFYFAFREYSIAIKTI